MKTRKNVQLPRLTFGELFENYFETAKYVTIIKLITCITGRMLQWHDKMTSDYHNIYWKVYAMIINLKTPSGLKTLSCTG